ncbi:hypothetical protein EVAR_29429_1 [Eumeta japonica]|uniref:Uncharacterized protein n=1 Tax=Eumeta variegata TaxID=151549 RepID=A0A4C1VW01_EUMVA|nr:hypothetical protein EVAR_29429_1 [Eumeta japonica]
MADEECGGRRVVATFVFESQGDRLKPRRKINRLPVRRLRVPKHGTAVCARVYEFMCARAVTSLAAGPTPAPPAPRPSGPKAVEVCQAVYSICANVLPTAAGGTGS